MINHPLFNTTQGKRQFNAMYAPLHKLSRHTPPEITIRTWSDFVQERFTEPGLEGLTGSAATYHLTDTAGYVMQAAQIAAGIDSLHVTRIHDFPRNALYCLAKAFGYRYGRGVKGLHAALIESAVPCQAVSQFEASRWKFCDSMEAQLTAAHLVNEGGECPAAAIKAVQMFTDEMVKLAYWLERTGEAARGQMITTQMGQALVRLEKCKV